jgi:formylglycine-generating enzyme required for sulfatase activity
MALTETASAERRIQAFRGRFGERHFDFARHAAFPLALTPDLLHRLRLTFQRDERSGPCNAPWIAVADLLLSALCRQVGYETYEMDRRVQHRLLTALRDDLRFGEQRLEALSAFIEHYYREGLHSPHAPVRALAQAQTTLGRWLALGYVTPEQAAHKLAAQANRREEQGPVRFAALCDALEGPLADYAQVLAWIRAGEPVREMDFPEAKVTVTEARIDLPSPGTVFREKGKHGPGPELVVIPAGEFWMGSKEDERDRYDNEGPRHRVHLSTPFAMGRFPVTVGEYLRFVEATGSHAPEWAEAGSQYNVETGTDDHYKQLGAALTREDHPIVGVSWHDALAYTEWLSAETGEMYRLPTEAEWEYAARAGTETRYWWGDEVEKGHANCATCGSQWDRQSTSPVAAFAPNPFGLHDMLGNVWEWCQDWYGPYSSEPVTDPTGPTEPTEEGALRVVRGGSFVYGAEVLRCAYRDRRRPELRRWDRGLRCVRAPRRQP